MLSTGPPTIVLPDHPNTALLADVIQTLVLTIEDRLLLEGLETVLDAYLQHRNALGVPRTRPGRRVSCLLAGLSFVLPLLC